MNGDAALNAMIATVRKLGQLAPDAAAQATPLVEAAAKKTAAAGTTPDGTPWVPTKTKSGGRALVNAAAALSAAAVGSAVVLTLKGVEVIHNFGNKKDPKRQILPDGGAGIPKPIAEAVTEGARRAFARATGGG